MTTQMASLKQLPPFKCGYYMTITPSPLTTCGAYYVPIQSKNNTIIPIINGTLVSILTAQRNGFLNETEIHNMGMINLK